MDFRRLSLALLLTAGVVFVTPVLFPSMRPVPRTSVTPAPGPAGPSASQESPPGAAGPGGVAGAGTTDPSATRASPPGPVARSTVAQQTVPPADTTPAIPTVVTTPLARYTFSSRGAVLQDASLGAYRSLAAGGDSAVTLARPGEALLTYAVIAGGDTLPLRDVAFTRVDSGGRTVTYDGAAGPGRVRVSYTLPPADAAPIDDYAVGVRITVRDLPTPAFLLTQLPSGIRSEEADTLEDYRHSGAAFKPQGRDAAGVPFGSLDMIRVPGQTAEVPERRVERGPIEWVVTKNKFFAVGLLADTTVSPIAEAQFAARPPHRTPSSFLFLFPTERKVHHAGDAVAVFPLGPGGVAFTAYTGPQSWRRLRALGHDFEHVNPYGGWLQGVVQPFATIVMRLLLWMKAQLAVGYGWILVIFGVAIRIAMWPLMQGSMRTSLKLQRIQPQLQAVQQKYAKQPEKYRDEVMRIYREHDMSPFSAFSGCLPMLLPMPILFAMFFVFQNTIEFRDVPFWWMADISLKDPLYILPVVMGLSMYLTTWIGMRGLPPNPNTKLMLYFLPAMMTVFLLNLAAGLNLYYAAQNLAALPQQWLLARERAKANGGGPAPR
jgi:YidC/Oxa1 family membrane protein insertase